MSTTDQICPILGHTESRQPSLHIPPCHQVTDALGRYDLSERAEGSLQLSWALKEQIAEGSADCIP